MEYLISLYCARKYAYIVTCPAANTCHYMRPFMYTFTAHLILVLADDQKKMLSMV
jgi:hypothetical protein